MKVSSNSNTQRPRYGGLRHFCGKVARSLSLGQKMYPRLWKRLIHFILSLIPWVFCRNVCLDNWKQNLSQRPNERNEQKWTSSKTCRIELKMVVNVCYRSLECPLKIRKLYHEKYDHRTNVSFLDHLSPNLPLQIIRCSCEQTAPGRALKLCKDTPGTNAERSWPLSPQSNKF